MSDPEQGQEIAIEDPPMLRPTDPEVKWLWAAVNSRIDAGVPADEISVWVYSAIGDGTIEYAHFAVVLAGLRVSNPDLAAGLDSFNLLYRDEILARVFFGSDIDTRNPDLFPAARWIPGSVR